MLVEKISIISKEISGVHTGHIKGSPDIKAIGMTPVEMVKNIIHVVKTEKKVEKEKK